TSMVLFCASPITVNSPCAAENDAVTAGRTRRSSSSNRVSSTGRARRDGRRRPGRLVWALRSLCFHMSIISEAGGKKPQGARKPPARGPGTDPRRRTQPDRPVTTALEFPYRHLAKAEGVARGRPRFGSQSQTAPGQKTWACSSWRGEAVAV